MEDLDLRDNYLGEGDVWPNLLQHTFFPGGKISLPGERILNTTIRRLQLANNRLTASGVSKLAEVLPNLEALETLELYNNPDIGQVGIERLAHALEVSRKHCCLSTLNVAICNVGDDGVKALSDVLCKENQRITMLDVSDNNVSDRGAMALADSLRFNQGLRILRLKLNHIGPLGAEQFRQTLDQPGAAVALEEVDLSANICSAADLPDKSQKDTVEELLIPLETDGSEAGDLAGESSPLHSTVRSTVLRNSQRDPLEVLRF